MLEMASPPVDNAQRIALQCGVGASSGDISTPTKVAGTQTRI